ncbi:hypothetical protein DM47_3060 [Burkholderia mallei]|nr:hypothetical protein DM75_3792 [Burkholderia mallei]KGX68261.1 hypothetical protein Y026_5299 [Burkholderia pseudomallei TSV28]KOS97309.1 hypothetical protein DM49_3608 [Burkholderia mallei]KOT02024.1 hypothetical protein DM50_3676 [Burkholderia mallei]KOT16136.1 hypothetical protein DM47_3060 [Burkholderia mallei]
MGPIGFERGQSGERAGSPVGLGDGRRRFRSVIGGGGIRRQCPSGQAIITVCSHIQIFLGRPFVNSIRLLRFK